MKRVRTLFATAVGPAAALSLTACSDRDKYAKQLQASGQFTDVLSSVTPRDSINAGLLQPYDQNGDRFMTVVRTLRTAGVTPLQMAGAEPWAAACPLSGIITADVTGSNPDWVKDRCAGKVKFTDSDVKGQLAAFDAAWDKAAK
jgi:hypothetical protein